ncbi:MAG: inorganic phosphate transporter [Rhabdochlamydiaceae bacterium]
MELVVLIVIFGLLFDFTNGFHDAANVVATPIATKVIRPAIAILIASIFNFLGATQISGVAQTITTGLVGVEHATQLMVLSAVIGAILWNLVTWYFGVPSSSSYALIGGLIGAAFVSGGVKSVLWYGVTYKVPIPMVVSPILGCGIAWVFMSLLLKISKRDRPFYKYFQLGSSATVALSHGLNDAQKSMGIITLGLFSAGMVHTTHIPLWVIGACAVMIALGTASGGFRIIRTMGFEITELKPIDGFAAEFSSSVVILVASFMGMPLSSTHIIVGSITGVGTARGTRHVRWATAHKMALAWVLTLPGAAVASGLIFYLLERVRCITF